MATRIFSWSCLRVFVLIALAVQARIIIASDSPIVPVVHILATDPCAAELGQETGTFTVFRDGPTSVSLTVRYSLAGSASNGVDYAALSGEVTIPVGASSAPITISPVDDNLVEGSESVVAFLDQPAVWPPPYLVCWPSFALGHIEDNDLGPTNRPPLVRLINPPDGSVFVGEVDLRLIARASDPDGRVRSVEFFDGTNSLGVVFNRPIIVRPDDPVIGDPVIELADELDPLLFPEVDANVTLDPSVLPLDTFSLIWSNVPPGSHVIVAVATDNFGASSRSEPVHIRVIEAPVQTIVSIKATDPVATEPDDNASRLDTATFVVHRTGNTDFSLTVFYRIGGTAFNGVDYRELPRSVTIPRGARGAEIIVAPLPDKAIEGPESVVLTVVPPICIEIYPPPPECYLVGREDTARAVINDNDPANRPPVVEIVRPFDGTIFLAPADIEIVAQARDYDGKVVFVEFFEGTNSLGRATNDWSRLTADRPAFAVKWPAVPPGRYILTAVATDDDGAQGRSKPVEIKVVDRTLRPVVTVSAIDAEGAETSLNSSPNPAVFAVKRTGPTERELVVYYSLAGTAINGTDYQLLLKRVTIPVGEASARIVVDPIDDRLVEGIETVGITVDPPGCIAIFPPPYECYLVGVENQARAVILDNDTISSNLPPKVALVRPEPGSVFVAPASIGLVAAASDPDGFVRTVEFFEGTNRLGIVSNTLVRVADGNVIGIDPVIAIDALFRFQWENVPPGEYKLRARATDNRGASAWSDIVDIKVVADHALPVVTIEAVDPYASEGDPRIDAVVQADGTVGIIGPPIIQLPEIASFSVKRDRGTNLPLTVFYKVGGTASNGVDYVRLEGKVVIPAGQHRSGIIVVPLDDRLIEGTETVVVELEPVACPLDIPPSPGCYQVGDPARAIAYIRDNDFENRPPKVDLIKPANEQTFPAGADIPIVAETVDSDGYVGMVEFFANDKSIGKDIRVFIIAPPPGQKQEFSMVWSNVPAGRYVLTAEATDDDGAVSRSGPVVIHVVEPCRLPVVSIEAVDKIATEQDPRIAGLLAPDQGRFRVSRTCRTNDELHVRYEVAGTADNGVDYRKLDGLVVIPAGAWSADIVVDPIDDELSEETETVIVKLVGLNCAVIDPVNGECFELGSATQDIVYIRDNENVHPRLAIVQPQTGDDFRPGSDIPIIVQAVDPDGWVSRVEFFANDRLIGKEEIIFIQPPPPGQLQRFSMIWSNVTAGRYVLTARATDNDGLTGLSAPVVIEVHDSPALPVVTIFAVDPLAREGAPLNPATFRIRRSGGTNALLTVHYSIRGTASNGVDYARIPNSVTIPAGRRSVRVTITPFDDRLVERYESAVLRLEATALYNVGRPGRAGALILDNDCPRPDTCPLPEGDFHVCRKLDGFRCYRVEVSDDLRDWESLGSNVLDDDAVHFVDPEAGERTKRFYRIVPCLDVEVFVDE